MFKKEICCKYNGDDELSLTKNKGNSLYKLTNLEIEMQELLQNLLDSV